MFQSHLRTCDLSLIAPLGLGFCSQLAVFLELGLKRLPETTLAVKAALKHVSGAVGWMAGDTCWANMYDIEMLPMAGLGWAPRVLLVSCLWLP